MATKIKQPKVGARSRSAIEEKSDAIGTRKRLKITSNSIITNTLFSKMRTSRNVNRKRQPLKLT